MKLLVKICGVLTEDALEAAVAAGADAIGFVFHKPSVRNLEPQRAAALASKLPRGVLRVAVSLHPGQADVDRVLKTFQPDVWQSDAGDFEKLNFPAGIERWPVMRSAGEAGQKLPPRLLFDAPESGVGVRADWNQAALLARSCELVLGGGLDISNVGKAIATVRPFGVDVSSGVESAPGIKDAALIRVFITAARKAAAEPGT